MPDSCQLLVWLGFCLLLHWTVAMRCRVPYEVVGGYCYYIDNEEPLPSSFSNSCYQDKRTTRLCLNSAEQMHILANYLYEIGYQNGTQFWTAGHRWPGDGQFYWNYYGRARTLNYTNWLVGEPTPHMGLNCMLLTLQHGQLYMASASCHSQAIDICEQLLTNEQTVMH